MHIAFCTDSNYIMPTGVAMISVCENNRCEQLSFHLVVTDEDIDDIVLEKKFYPLRHIAKKYGCECYLYPIESSSLSSFECSGVGHVSTAGFARVFIPELLEESIKKIIYLDCDVIVNGSLREMWDIELNDLCPFAAVTDANGCSASYRYNLELPLTVEYYNSGVLLMNLDCWRKNNYTRKSIECASKHKFPFLDQDMLNYLFADKAKSLSIKFNYQTLFEFTPEMYWMVDYKYVDEIRNIIKGDLDPVVIHYISSNKPWKNEWCPRREVWNKYCNMSQWKDISPQNVVTRFDRCNIYKKFIDAYWADPKLMQEVLDASVDLQMAAVKLRNKHIFVKIGMTSAKWMADILSWIFSIKTKDKCCNV